MSPVEKKWGGNMLAQDPEWDLEVKVREGGRGRGWRGRRLEGECQTRK